MEEAIARVIELYEDGDWTFTGPYAIFGGLLVGVLLGFVLDKGGMNHFSCTSGMLRLQNFKYWRIGMPTLLTGMFFYHLLSDIGVIDVPVTKTMPIGMVVGAILFGASLAISGYCPAIGAAALGSGRIAALPFMLGLTAGMWIYGDLLFETELVQFIIKDIGPLTWSNFWSFGYDIPYMHWFMVAGFLFFGTLFFLFIGFFDTINSIFRRSLKKSFGWEEE